MCEGCDDVWYADTDGDMHGTPGARMIACAQPAGHVALGDDCDDTQALVFPGGMEVCDGLDNDCSSTTAEVCSSGCVVRVRPDDSRRYLFCAVAATFANATSRCATEPKTAPSSAPTASGTIASAPTRSRSSANGIDQRGPVRARPDEDQRFLRRGAVRRFGTRETEAEALLRRRPVG